MNNLYFACCDCKIYIFAGYRWAYWELEHTGVVSRKTKISAESVLAANSFWNPPKEETYRWLYEDVFPSLKKFLQDHRRHRVVFGELEDFTSHDDYYWDWMDIGHYTNSTPRYLVEVLGLNTWEQVEKYMGELGELAPAWWENNYWRDPPTREKGRRRFEKLVQDKQPK